MSDPVLVTCALGIAPILADEIRALGLEVVREEAAAVETRADAQDRMRLLLHLRTAHRVLMPILSARVHTPKVLYYKLIKYPWEQHLGPDGYLRVHGYVQTDQIRDDRFAFLKVKDAIMDRLRTQHGRRPDSGPSDHGAGVYLHWVEDKMTVSLDLSGPPLSRRGYREAGGKAPMQEALAAAMLLGGGWDGTTPLLSPLGGSGTLAIEAALIALNRAPGILRPHFGLFALKEFDADAWHTLCEEARSKEKDPEEIPSVGMSDVESSAIRHARHNADRAGVEKVLSFEQCDFRESTIPAGPCWLAINPPYGKRLQADDDVAELYRELGVWMKSLDTGGRALVITANLPLAKRFGLKLAFRKTLYNGALECRLLGFDLCPPGGKT